MQIYDYFLNHAIGSSQKSHFFHNSERILKILKLQGHFSILFFHLIILIPVEKSGFQRFYNDYQPLTIFLTIFSQMNHAA